MKPLFTLVFASLLPLCAMAQTVPGDAPAQILAVTDVETVTEGPADPEASAEEGGDGPRIVNGLEVFDAVEVALDSFLWVKRPIIVFANTPADPAFQQQVEYILGRAAEFAERDVVLILDSDPAARSEARQRLRPRGFMLAILDKDGEVKQRRPAPRNAREIIAVIDRFPLRRQEMLEQRPSGRD
jgi:hypothetical protein